MKTETSQNARAIFDNGGGITLQIEGWAHHYSDPKEAANDYSAWLLVQTVEDWEGHEDEAAELDPSPEEIRNGGYRIMTPAEIAAARRSTESTGWNNVETFLAAVE